MRLTVSRCLLRNYTVSGVYSLPVSFQDGVLDGWIVKDVAFEAAKGNQLIRSEVLESNAGEDPSGDRNPLFAIPVDPADGSLRYVYL